MERSQVVEILDEYIDALNSGDCSSVRFAENVRFIGPVFDEPVEGREALVALLAEVTQGYKGVRTIRHIIEGSAACSLIEFETNDGEIIPIVDYFELDETGITFIRPYFDPRPILKE